VKFIEKLNQRFGFTKNESLVVFFLIGMFLIGGIFKIFFTTQSRNEQQFDYSLLDSELIARSSQSSDSLQEKPIVQQPNSVRTDSLSKKNQGDFSSKKTININTANVDELTQLPGVGPSVAHRIVDYRNEHGKFSSLEDLRNVKGIGAKKIEKLKLFLRVEK